MLFQDIGELQQQLTERKAHLRRQSLDGSVGNQQIATLNWDFLRGVFHDKTTLLTGTLKACKAELAQTENRLTDREKQLEKTETEVKSLYW